MGTAAEHSSSSPAVEAVSPRLSTHGKRSLRQTVLTHLVVAVAAVSIYQGVWSLFSAQLHHPDTKPTTSLPASPQRRDLVETRASGDAIWNQIKPSEELEWHACYKSFQCARLTAPLDYWNGSDGTISLAIVKLPAKVSITDPRYGGPILINPGGPGVSATQTVVELGSALQGTVDTPGKPPTTQDNPNARYYDIVGIDPRGVGQSLPLATCFETEMQRAQWELREAAEGILGSSNIAVATTWGRQRAFGLGCHHFAQRKNQTDNIFPYMTTASIARDMITFVDRFGQWRECEAARMLKGHVPAHLRYQEGQEKVNYYGFSWGSFLGMTFASMFPARIGRFVLDAIVLTDDYIHSRWAISVRDSEKVVDYFFANCASVGPKRCALATPGSTADDVRQRFSAILDAHYRHPVASTGAPPDMLTWSDLMSTVMESLYQPTLWGTLARTLAALESTVASPLVARVATTTHYPAGGAVPSPYQTYAAQAGIGCSDAVPTDDQHWTLADAQHHWAAMHARSPHLAATFAHLRMLCAAWPRPSPAPHAFRGPFGTRPGGPAPPILFTANRLDPVTPHYAATQMVPRFAGARLLTLDMPGHSSQALASACLARRVRAFFHAAALPPPGAVCEPSEEPFEAPAAAPQRRAQRDWRDVLDDPHVEAAEEDAALVAAQREMRAFFAKLWRRPGTAGAVL